MKKIIFIVVLSILLVGIVAGVALAASPKPQPSPDLGSSSVIKTYQEPSNGETYYISQRNYGHVKHVSLTLNVRGLGVAEEVRVLGLYGDSLPVFTTTDDGVYTVEFDTQNWMVYERFLEGSSNNQVNVALFCTEIWPARN